MKALLAALAVSALAVAAAAQQAPPAELTRAPGSVWDGAYTEEQSKRGETIYRQECSVCHGVALTGGEEAGPLAGAGFTANWNGVTVGDLFERIRVSMPPTHPGRLGRSQIADVLAFILSANKFPAGRTELASRLERLRLIRFEATRR